MIPGGAILVQLIISADEPDFKDALVGPVGKGM